MRLNDEQKIELAKLYKENWKLDDLVKRFGVTKSAIIGILKRRGIHRAVIRKYVFDATYFDDINSEDKAYWLGFIFGDGSIDATSRSLRIDLNNRDRQHLEKFKISIKANYNILKSNIDMSLLCINDVTFCKKLSKYNIIPNKTYLTTSLPMDEIPENLQKHFIRGLLDADGWYTKSIHRKGKSQYQFGVCNHSLNIIKQIKNWFKEHNLDGGCIVERSGANSYVCQYTVLGNNNFKNMFKLLYDDSSIYLDRKYEKIKEILTEIN